MTLERQYRLLARAFPTRWRDRNGDDLVCTLLDGSAEGQRLASPADAADVVRHGLAARLRTAGPFLQIGAATAVLAVTVGVVHSLLTPTPLAFLLTSLVVVLIPGTGVVYSVSTAIGSGWQRGSMAAVGCTLGIVPHLVAASIGLSGVMQAGAEVFEVVRWVGVAYLAYLGFGMIRSAGGVAELGSGASSPASIFATIRRGVLLNVLNPKLTSAVRQRVLAAPRLLRRVERSLGVVLIGFAARLAIADR